jgi:hypothetical protein
MTLRRIMGYYIKIGKCTFNDTVPNDLHVLLYSTLKAVLLTRHAKPTMSIVKPCHAMTNHDIAIAANTWKLSDFLVFSFSPIRIRP